MAATTRGSGAEAERRWTPEGKTVKIMYSNVQSIFNKLNEITTFVVEVKPDFILLTETWCKGSINDPALSLPGYQLETDLRRDREDTTNCIGGGLLVYTKTGIKVAPRRDLENCGFLQCCAFSILTSEEPVTIVLIYRPPNSNNDNTDKLCKLTRNLPKNSILIGDFNFPKINWENGGGSEGGGGGGAIFQSAVHENNLAQLVEFSTHTKGNTLDLLITNMSNNIISVSNSAPVGKSDH